MSNLVWKIAPNAPDPGASFRMSEQSVAASGTNLLGQVNSLRL
jgi:hypothetical protein